MSSFQSSVCLTRRVTTLFKVAARRSPFVRYNSSINNKVALNNSTRTVEKDKVDTATPTASPTTSSSHAEEKPDKASKPATEKLSFVPVINIPKTEFAYHSFFSLHRPLFGLADDSDKPFFSSKTLEEEAQDRLDDALAECMKDLQPFVPPEEITAKEQMETRDDRAYSDKFVEDIEDAVNDEELLFYSEFNRKSELPVHHMPDSSEVVEFLSDVEKKLKLEDEELAQVERKLEMIQKAKSKRYQQLKRNKKP